MKDANVTMSVSLLLCSQIPEKYVHIFGTRGFIFNPYWFISTVRYWVMGKVTLQAREF